VAVLQVNQRGKNAEHHHAGHNAFFIHEGEQPRAAILATRSRNGIPKVNEGVNRVKPQPANATPKGLRNPASGMTGKGTSSLVPLRRRIAAALATEGRAAA
jgi:hypothetical protein